MTGQLKQQDEGLKGFSSLPERKSLGRHVYENIRRAIIRGDLKSGSRVVETRVAGALGISRTPVREAIHKLEREGLLQQYPTGGFFVAGLTRSDIKETFGIRSVLESYAARLAAVHYQPGELEPLERKIDEYQQCLEQGRMASLTLINTQFHDLLYSLSRSPRLIKMINDLRDQIFRFRQIILQVEDMARKSNEDHRLMLRFIRLRDTERVEVVVREHILRGQEVVLRELDRQHL